MRQGHFYLLLALVLVLLPAVSANIVSVTTPIAAGTYGAGSQIPLVLTYDAPITVQGSPVLTTTVGNAVLQSQSGATITFLYTVPQSGTGSVNGVLNVQSLDTTQGNVSDANTTLPTNATNLNITANSAVNSSPSITFAMPAVSTQSGVSTNVTIGGPTVTTTNAQLSGSATQNNVCLNCTITLADGSYTFTITATNSVNLTSSASTQLRVDTAAPTISSVQLLLPSAVAVSAANQTIDISQTQVNLSVSATDNITYLLNGASATSQLQLQPGFNTVVVDASDGVYTTSFQFYIRVSQPFNVAALASTLASHGVTLTAVVNGLDITGDQTLLTPYLNATLVVNNVTYTLTNVYIPAIAQNAAASVSVLSADNTFLGNANASVLYWYSNILNAKAVFTQFDSLSVQVVYPYTSANTNVTLLSFDGSSGTDNNITRPTLTIANGNATFAASGFGVAIGEDATAPSIVDLSVQSVADTTATILISTTEPASCRISTHIGTYGNMTLYSEFAVPAEYVDTPITLNNLRSGTGYTYYVSCIDRYGNAMNTSLSLALTTTGTASDQTSIGDTTTTTTTGTTSSTSTLSSGDRDLVTSLGRDPSQYVSISEHDSQSSVSNTPVDIAQLLNYTAKVSGQLIPTTTTTSATSYDLTSTGGSTITLTQVTVSVVFPDVIPSRFDVIEAIPKNVATSSNKLSGTYTILESDPVVRFSFGSGDVSGRTLTFTYTISGERTNAATDVLTFVSNTGNQITSTSPTGGGSTVVTPAPNTGANGSSPSSGGTSGWKIFWYTVVIILAIIGIIWAVGKIIAKQRGGGRFGGYSGSGSGLYRESFSYRD